MVKLVKANIRKDGAVLIIFSLIMILAAFLLNLALMVSRYRGLYDEYVDETGLEDYTVFAAYSYAGEDVDVSSFFDDAQYVKSYDISELVMLNSFSFTTSINSEEKTASEWMFQNIKDPGASDDIIFTDRDESVSGRKIYMNIYDATSNGLSVGDKIYIESEQGDYEYTLAGIYQHMTMGSFATYYSVMVEPDEFDRLKNDRDEALKNGADLSWDHIITVNIKDGYDVEACLKDTKESLTEDFFIPDEGIANQESVQAYVSVVNILAAFMGAFAVLILVISVVIIVFTMNNNINRDVRNIGALKAVGYTVGQIRRALMAEYIILGLLGSSLGIAISYVLFPVLEKKYIRSISGLIWKNRFFPVFAISILLGVAFIVILTTFLSTSKVKELHPANALRFGLMTSKPSKNHMPLARTKGKVDILLAMKSFLQSKGQNAIITGIMFSVAFVIMFSLVLYYNTSVDINNFQRMVMGDVADAYFYVDDKSSEAVEKSIEGLKEIDDVSAAYGLSMTYAYIGEKQTDLIYSTDPGELNCELYEGVMPDSDDETVLGSSLADEIGAGVGDKIDVSYGGKTKTFTVTGLQQSAINNRLYVTDDAAEELGVIVSYDNIRVRVEDADEEKVDRVLRDGEDLGDDNIINTENNNTYQHSNDNVPVFAVGFIVLILVILNVAIVFLVVRLLLKTIFVKREKEFGIKKALGFTSTQLRIQLALSLIPATVMGTVSGAVSGYFLVNPLFALVLSGYGLKKSNLIIRPELMIVSSVVVTLLVFVLSYIMSHRMKKVSAYQLIQE